MLRAIAVSALAAAALVAPARAEWQSFRAATDGLASDKVFSIAEAGDGALWFGTLNGASRFDGSRWSTIVDSLPQPIVFSLLEDRRGQMWFGLQNGGVARFDGQHWARWNAAGGTLPSNQVNAVLEDHRGDLWFAVIGGLVRHEPGLGRWTVYLAGAGSLVHPSASRLLEDSANNLWIATSNGVSRLDSTRSQWTSFTQDAAALGRDSVLALGKDTSGHVWFGTDQGVWSFGADGWRHFGAADGLVNNAVTAIACDSLGRMWFGTMNGVSRFDGRTFRSDTRAGEGPFFGQVASLYTDRSGNVWVGTATSGVFRYDGVAWRNYYAGNPPAQSCSFTATPNVPSVPVLPSNCLTAMLQDRAGDHWFATHDGGTARLDRRGVWSAVRRASGVPLSDSLQTLVEDRAKNLWFGSSAAGIARLDSTRAQWTLFRRANGLAGDSVRAAFVDRAGDVWVGTTNGVSRYTGAAWSSYLRGGVSGVPVEVRGFLEDAAGNLWMRTSVALYALDPARAALSRYGIAQGLTDDVITAMLEARDGALWFGTAHGLNRLRSGAWATYGTAGDSTVNALFETRAGLLWVAGDFTASRFDGAAWRVFTGSEIGSTPVTGFFQDGSGTVWLSTLGGLARYNGATWRNYHNRGDGPSSDQVTGFFEDSQHRLWFMSDEGLTEHEPDRVAPQTVYVNRPTPLLPSRNVSFVFGAAYGEVADLEYSVSWDGEPFSAYGSDNTFNLTGVPDGLHAFEVRSRDWVRASDPSAAIYRFEVDATPPPAVISSPVFGQPVRGTIAVAGTASDARFASFRVEVKPASVASWTAPGVVTLASSNAAVNDGSLAPWNTSSFAEGDWDARLSVTDTLGLVGVSQIKVIVDNAAPFANVTSPARVNANDGGDVFTTAADVHVYFPPHAFDQDADVTIDPLATTSAPPDTLPDGAVRVSGGYDIGWQKGRLVKNGTLFMRPTLAVPAGRPLAVYVAPPTGAWQRLGGTAEGTGLALNLSSASRYALFAEVSPASSGGGVSGVTLSPRVFSPQGSFATTDVAIGFTLGRAGSVTVKVYNRAGRLIRTVADGLALGPGANLVRWDGRDRDGDVAEEGIYLVTVAALGETKTTTLGVVR